MSVLPLTGESVKCQFMEIDELEAKCWIKDYGIFGTLENHNLSPQDVNKKEHLCVIYVDKELKQVYLAQ